MAQGRQTPLGEPLVRVIVVEVGDPLTGFAAEFADIVAQGGAGDQPQVNEAPSGLEGTGHGHGHVVDTGNVMQSFKGGYLHAQPQQLIDILAPEAGEELAVLLRHAAVQQLLLRAEGKIHPRIKGQGLPLSVQQHLQKLQVTQGTVPLGGGVAMVRGRVQQ